jgi:hypothetical protein
MGCMQSCADDDDDDDGMPSSFENSTWDGVSSYTFTITEPPSRVEPAIVHTQVKTATTTKRTTTTTTTTLILVAPAPTHRKKQLSTVSEIKENEHEEQSDNSRRSSQKSKDGSHQRQHSRQASRSSDKYHTVLPSAKEFETQIIPKSKHH